MTRKILAALLLLTLAAVVLGAMLSHPCQWAPNPPEQPDAATTGDRSPDPDGGSTG